MEETERLCNANQTVKNHMVMSMGTGLIPIPIVDLIALSGVQMKMLHKLTQLYEIPFSLGEKRFTWGSGQDLTKENQIRKQYIEALRTADRYDYSLLLQFVRY